MSDQSIWFFGNGTADGDGAMKELLGGKGAGLAEMSRLGLPVPPGFTIPTTACTAFFEGENILPSDLLEAVSQGMARVGELTGKRFGDSDNPLLVSVRSGAPISMPGMMDTVLNLGLNDETVVGLGESSGDPRFAWDAYRRFMQMFGSVVLGVQYSRLARELDRVRGEREEADLTVEELQLVVERLKGVIDSAGKTFPEDVNEQLRLAIEAVFLSFNTARARFYRKSRGISDDTGTAVNVQAMVFGNTGETSATGVAFTRNPKSGEAALFGEWLPNAQGEDVVAGTHTPLPLYSAQTGADPSLATLEATLPEAFAHLEKLQKQLELHFRDMQDIEFTIERGQLYLLQTRTGKRTPGAAVQIVVDLVNEGIITVEEALGRIDAGMLEMVLRPVLDPDAPRKVLAKGLDASPGAASGRVVFHAEDAQEMVSRGEKVVLVRNETSPEDIQGMTAAEGILTARGGQTSHAAVVARSMGKPCVVGCNDIVVDYARQLFYAGDTVVRRGDFITLDGASGTVMEGQVPMLLPPTESGSMHQLLVWADERARLTVRANADNAHDASRARSLGATGIGLCRTEHMFFRPDALRAMRQMILAEDSRSRTRALAQVLPLQRDSFAEIFRAMDGLPVTIRLLDPPLHEFLPTREEDVEAVAADLGIRAGALRHRLEALEESNPMLGHRGCRIGITTPEIYATQVRAIMEAACLVASEGAEVLPEIMIPLVAIDKELSICREQAIATAEKVLEEQGQAIDFKVGTMIEVPRAALTAYKVAEHADFFSFGTNDLTQLTYGFSRDDMGKFLPGYLKARVLEDSPLSVFDQEGVGELVKIAAEAGKAKNANLKVGVCGEHGGDPKGVRFFHAQPVDYVSCSPFRVPVARLAAAQAALSVGDV